MHESCHACKCVILRTWMSRVMHMHESCHVHKGVMSRTWMSHVTHTNKTFHSNERVMSRICIVRDLRDIRDMRDMSHTNESCHEYTLVTNSYTHIHVSLWLMHIRDIRDMNDISLKRMSHVMNMHESRTYIHSTTRSNKFVTHAYSWHAWHAWHVT